MMRLWPALPPHLPVGEDLFALQAFAQLGFGYWKQSTRSPYQAATQLPPRLPVPDLFALRAVAHFGFGYWKQSTRSPHQARPAATPLSIPRLSKGIAPPVPPANWSQAQTQSNWSG
jgi:hypothetical protein